MTEKQTLFIKIDTTMCEIINIEICNPAALSTVGFSLSKNSESISVNIVPTYET